MPLRPTFAFRRVLLVGLYATGWRLSTRLGITMRKDGAGAGLHGSGNEKGRPRMGLPSSHEAEIGGCYFRRLVQILL